MSSTGGGIVPHKSVPVTDKKMAKKPTTKRKPKQRLGGTKPK